MSDEKRAGFTVTDRRAVGRDEDKPAEPTVPGRPTADMAAEGDDAHDAGDMPPVDFHTFMLSLGSSALMHLGEIEHPATGTPQQDLALARHTIELLGMLEEKTRGNLTPAEDKLMQSLLGDLRLRYVDAVKKK